MDRDEFMELVYETFADEPDNVLANGIIEAADAYVEHEKAQLSQEDTTKDTISRQAAIDALDCISGVEEVLKSLPSVQPEPKEGHWIEGGIYRDVIECYCSECGQLMTTAATVRMNYCPNCGARMKGATP